MIFLRETHPLRLLTEEGRKALSLVEEAIQNQQVTYVNYQKSLKAFVFCTTHVPTGVICQNKPLLWLHLPVSPSKVLMPYFQQIASMLQIISEKSRKVFGIKPQTIGLNLTNKQIEWLYQNNNSWGITLANYTKQLEIQLPSDKLFQFTARHEFVIPKIVQTKPISLALTVFTDGSSNGNAAYRGEGITIQWQTGYSSAQEVKLEAVCKVLQQFHAQPLNIILTVIML